MADPPRVQIPLIVSVERDLGAAKQLVTYLGFPHVCVEIAGADGAQDPFPTPELFARIVSVAELQKGEVARGEPSVVPLDLVAEVEAGRDADVPEPIGSVLRAKRSACRIECAHAGEVLLSGGELTWIDAANEGLWIVEPAADQEGSVAFKPSSPRAIASEILELLPRT